jgi:hypothetical protein
MVAHLMILPSPQSPGEWEKGGRGGATGFGKGQYEHDTVMKRCADHVTHDAQMTQPLNCFA